MYRQLAQEFLELKLSNKPFAIDDMARKFNIGEAGVITYLTFVENGVTPGKLSEVFKVSTARISSILNSLEKKKAITRQCDPNDRRKIIVSASDEICLKHNRRLNEMIDHIAIFLEKLGEKDSLELIRLNKKLDAIILKYRKGLNE